MIIKFQSHEHTFLNFKEFRRTQLNKRTKVHNYNMIFILVRKNIPTI